MTLFTAEGLIRAASCRPEDLDGMAPAWGSTTGWTGPDALGVAVWCALGTDDVRAGLLAAVNHDGDSDSTRAMPGSLVGAVHGDVAILDWASSVDAAGVVDQTATDCFRHLRSAEPVDEPGVAIHGWRYPPW